MTRSAETGRTPNGAGGNGPAASERATDQSAADGPAAGESAARGSFASERWRRVTVVAAAAGAAAAVNLLVYAAGRAAGGTFAFTSQGRPAEVDALTVAGFSVVPLALGLTAVALLGPRWGRAALVAGPTLAVLTIVGMTIPADFDTTSTVTLALCHLALVPILIVAIRSLTRRPAGPTRPTTAG